MARVINPSPLFQPACYNPCMPYVFLGIGVLLGFFGLYRFFLAASTHQVKTMIFSVLTGALALALFLLAVTGRLPLALAAVSALWPLGVAMYRRRLQRQTPSQASPKIVTRADALAILGLTDPASDDDIQAAYKRLMQGVHPDKQGSAWLASQLNTARDFLLK